MLRPDFLDSTHVRVILFFGLKILLRLSASFAGYPEDDAGYPLGEGFPPDDGYPDDG